jgi:glutathione synthase/RimK-type ligase-like ATP-grasp enzyme
MADRPSGICVVTIVLSENWDEICTPRLGVAQLTQRAFAGENLRPLWDKLMEVATDDVAGSGMGMDLSIISQLLGDKPTGLAIQKDTLALQRLYRSPCVRLPRLRVLALAAEMDIGGNTPLEFLLQGSDIELATFYVVPGMPLPEKLPDHDVAIIVAPDGDATRETLAVLAALAPAWPRPLLNPPEKIAQLDRDRLCRCLDAIPGLEIPRTAKLAHETLISNAADPALLQRHLDDAAFPLIIRPTGSHAGFGLAKLDNAAALTAYLEKRGETEFFLSRFVAYASGDGLYRKYRIVMVDGKAHACHMAICEDWKVWYLNADMAVSVPHRLEEAGFMRDFDAAFAVRHGAALDEMIARIGLDYVIIDCAETISGDLLVFEADNTAIVHNMDPPSVYPYKPAQMQKIFQAVQTMLYRKAGRRAAQAA